MASLHQLPYTLLGTSGLRVSALCLGTMTFGEEWGWGADKTTSASIFSRFAERGGNFIDTANTYTNGTSESWVGEFIHAERERFVVGTKYSLTTRPDDPNAGGNHRKNLVQSLEASLRNLRTDYVDVYWLHIWDFLTPAEEVMRALDDVVRAGKVLCVGVSDTPAWVISYANAVSELRGWSSFIGLQAEYNLIRRDAERDLLPMARSFGMTLMPWSPLANGMLTGKYNDGAAPGGRMAADSPSRNRPTERGREVARAVVAMAKEIGCSPSQLALAWLVHQPGSVVPIVGCRRVDQLDDNLGCLAVELTDAQLGRLDDISRFEPGFPHDFLTAAFTRTMVYESLADRIDAGSRPTRNGMVVSAGNARERRKASLTEKDAAIPGDARSTRG
jgi:aryl-alcohol dehydrogenase-like predicted oxidoreductase